MYWRVQLVRDGSVGFEVLGGDRRNIPRSQPVVPDFLWQNQRHRAVATLTQTARRFYLNLRRCMLLKSGQYGLGALLLTGNVLTN